MLNINIEFAMKYIDNLKGTQYNIKKNNLKLSLVRKDKDKDKCLSLFFYIYFFNFKF